MLVGLSMLTQRSWNKCRRDGEATSTSTDPLTLITKSPVRNPEASNYFPDGPTRDTLGDEGSDVEGAVIGSGRSGGVDGTR